MSKQLDLIFWQCKSENISHPKKFLVKKKKHKTNHTPQSVFWEIYSMYLKKKVESTFAASSVVQLHVLVRKHLIANIIYKISCIEALKNISLYSRKITFLNGPMELNLYETLLHRFCSTSNMFHTSNNGFLLIPNDLLQTRSKLHGLLTCRYMTFDLRSWSSALQVVLNFRTNLWMVWWSL